jgi:hypothetical protein
MSSSDIQAEGKWKSRLHKSGLALMLLALLVVGVQIIRIKVARAALERSLADIERAGEPTHVEDLFLPDVNPARNRLTLWREAQSHVQNANTDGTCSLTDLINSDLPLPADLARQADDLMKANSQALIDIDTAIACPYPCVRARDPNRPAWLQSSDDMSGAENLDELLCAATIEAHLHGNDAASIAFIVKTETLREDFKSCPGFFGSVCTYSNETRFAGTTTRISADWNRLALKTATKPNLPETEIRRIISSLLDEKSRSEDLHRAQLAQRILDADATLSFIGLGLTQTGTNFYANGASKLRVVLLPNALNTAADSLRYSTEAIRQSDGTVYSDIRQKVDAIEPVRGFLSMGSGHAWPLWVRETFKNRANRRLCATALAISLYVNDQGSFPKSLEDLKPRYMTELPIDPMTFGELLRYKTGAAPIIYSVGLDGTDDGGNDTDPVAGMPRETKDIVVHLLPK